MLNFISKRHDDQKFLQLTPGKSVSLGLLKGATRCSLLLLLDLNLCTVEDLEKGIHPCAHARVHVRFRALDVVVQVVAESKQQADGVLANRLLLPIAREKNECYIANIVAGGDTSNASEFARRLFSTIINWRTIFHVALSILELLEENFGKHHIISILKFDRKEDRDPVLASLQVDGFAWAVGNFANLRLVLAD